jgi:hypothetical protein
MDLTCNESTCLLPVRRCLEVVRILCFGTPFAYSTEVGAGEFSVQHNPSGTDLKSILDPSFRYTKSVETDLRKTFARVRRQLRKQQEAPQPSNVQPIRKDAALRAKRAR